MSNGAIEQIIRPYDKDSQEKAMRKKARRVPTSNSLIKTFETVILKFYTLVLIPFFFVQLVLTWQQIL